MVNRFFIPTGEAIALSSSWIDYISQLNGSSYKDILASDSPMNLGEQDIDEDSGAFSDEIAHISMIGPITRYSGFCSRLFGGVGIDAMTSRLNELENDDAVKAIVMEIDSPGGQAAGIADFADKVRSLSLKKPIISFVSDIGASAAYWIASASTKIVVSQTASVGSIGVYAAITDNTEAMQKQGYKEITFVSSQSPKKRPDFTSDEGKSQIQAQIDTLASVFIDSVAKFRGVDSETVQAKFGQGDVVFAQDAVDRGMADAVGTIEDAFKLASGMIQSRATNQSLSTQLSKPNNGGCKAMTRDEILSQFPEAAAEIARVSASEERERIRAIEALESDINMAVAGDIIKSAKYTDGVTASDVALKILNAQSEANAKMASAREEDAAAIPTTSAATNDTADADRESNAKLIAQAAAKYGKGVR